MANELLQVDRGLSTNLPATNEPGRILVTTDTQQMYIDDTAENRIHIQDDTKIPLAGSSAITGNLIPSATNTINLGSTTNEWNNIYGNIIHGNVVHAPSLATNEIEPDTNSTLVISGGTGNEVDIVSNVGIGGNLTIGSSTNTVVITPTALTLNDTAKTAWQTELGITQDGLTQEQADARYLQLAGGTMNNNSSIGIEGNLAYESMSIPTSIQLGIPEELDLTYSEYAGGLSVRTNMESNNLLSRVGMYIEQQLRDSDNTVTQSCSLTYRGIIVNNTTTDVRSNLTNTELSISNQSTNDPSIKLNMTDGLVLSPSILPKWQDTLQITPNALDQSTADSRYLQLTGTAASATKLATSRNFSITGGATANAVSFNGTQNVVLNITSLDATKLSGTIPTANLPSYVDDVVEYANLQAFPQTGESGKIYVALNTNLTYRWGGSEYVEISPSLALGTTADTAFRGDYGLAAYNHATSKGSNYAVGFYKISTNTQGHVTNAIAVTETDIGNLVDDRYLRLSGGSLTGPLGIQTITGTSTNSSVQISGLGIGFANSQGTNSTLNINRSSADGAITLNMTQGSNQVWITGSHLSFSGSALSNWQEALEIPKFVVSSTQPSDTNVIWLKPIA